MNGKGKCCLAIFLVFVWAFQACFMPRKSVMVKDEMLVCQSGESWAVH